MQRVLKKQSTFFTIDIKIRKSTSGTANAARNLVKKLGAEIVECAFIIELVDLRGRDKLKVENIYSVVEFED